MPDALTWEYQWQRPDGRAIRSQNGMTPDAVAVRRRVTAWERYNPTQPAAQVPGPIPVAELESFVSSLPQDPEDSTTNEDLARNLAEVRALLVAHGPDYLTHTEEAIWKVVFDA